MNKIFIALALVILLAAGYYFYQNKAQPQLVGDDRDIHGCIGSAGYSWCEPKQKCLRVWEEPCQDDNTEEAIRRELAKLNNKDPATTYVRVFLEIGDYAQGSVAFSPEAAEGGMFLAHKTDGQWTISYHGNGGANCPALKEEGYPAPILKNFCD